MRVFKSLEAAIAERALVGAAMALGNFDGVHVGHRALLARARRSKLSAALTFDPHPGKVLSPELAPKLISTTARKLELLEATGLDALVVHPFSTQFARVTADEFEDLLFRRLLVSEVVVGTDFTYGQKRAGTVKSLQAAAAACDASVFAQEPVRVDGVVASSSTIRTYLLEGRVEAAARFLGRPFDLDGVVVPGDGRGRTIGFPTANVDTDNELRPAAGVYAVALHDAAGVVRGGAANIGVKPTFGGGALTIEVHLFDFSGDLYGQKIRVQFLGRIRDERRFASVDELKVQINRDVESARETWARLAATASSALPR